MHGQKNIKLRENDIYQQAEACHWTSVQLQACRLESQKCQTPILKLSIYRHSPFLCVFLTHTKNIMLLYRKYKLLQKVPQIFCSI